MRILQISSTFPKDAKSGLYADLANGLADAGHELIVVAVDASATPQECELCKFEKISVLRVKSGSIFNTSKWKKGLSFIALPYLLKSAIKEKLGDLHFDLILFEAPPVTMWKVVSWAMAYFKCPSFLMQKDIFPQNAVDLKMFGAHSLPYFYFRHQEKMMLQTATYVGCMSQGNIDYLRAHNPALDKSKFVLFPNSKNPQMQPSRDRDDFQMRYGVPRQACVFLFAGNMGKPQNVDLICSAMEFFEGDKNIYFVAIGDGTESGRVRDFIQRKASGNSRFIKSLPRLEYERLAANCDVGIVSLDPRFTIPNYPSKTLSYMELSMPIVAVTDTVTDYKDLIQTQAKCGLWSDASNPDDFFANISALSSDAQLRAKFGENGRKYMAENFGIGRSVEIIEGIFCTKQLR